MNRLQAIGVAIVLGLGGGAAVAQTTETKTFSGINQVIPDNDPNGVQNVQNVGFSFSSISDIKVTLTLSADWSGDYYVYLAHGGDKAVLLNRVGRTAGNDVGYGDLGFDLTFSDSGRDVHNYQNFADYPGDLNADGELTGDWAPDARLIDPSIVLDSDPRSAYLHALYGTDPNGQWTLFLEDCSVGGSGSLVEWSLIVTSIPEPGSGSLLSWGALILAGYRWRQGRKS